MRTVAIILGAWTALSVPLGIVVGKLLKAARLREEANGNIS